MTQHAFPTPTHNLQNDGMTLRDYFAAKAMQGVFDCFTGNQFIPYEKVAEGAYRVADAMMKAREA